MKRRRHILFLTAIAFLAAILSVGIMWQDRIPVKAAEDVNVEEKVPLTILVEYEGEKNIVIGENIEKNLIKVVVYYSDGSNERVYDFTYSPMKVEKVGTTVVDVQYGELPTKEFTVYGIEEVKYQVAFDSKGGSMVGAINNIIPGDTIILPADPVREGYVFEGWYSDSTYTKEFTEKTPVNADLTVYAKWKKIPVEEIRAIYYGEPVEIGRMAKEADFQVYAIMEDGSTLIVPTADCNFASLVIAKSGVNEVVITYLGCRTAAIVYGADKTTYTVTFDSQGGSKVDAISAITPGSTISMPTEPTRKGYEFVNWYTSTSYDVIFDQRTVISSNMTVFAKWELADQFKQEKETYKLNRTVINLSINGQESLYIKSYDPYMKVRYKSSKPSVATVSATGIITAKKKGKTVITVTAPDKTKLKCVVNVGKKVLAKSIKLNKTRKTLKVKKTFQIKATLKPKNVTFKNLKYRSSDKSVATVDKKGKVKAKDVGTCYIYVTTLDGSNRMKRIKITVKK